MAGSEGKKPMARNTTWGADNKFRGMRQWLRASALVPVMFSSTLSAAAQAQKDIDASPSLEETQLFIQQRLPELAHLAFSYTQSDGAVVAVDFYYDAVHFDGTELSVTNHFTTQATWPNGSRMSPSTVTSNYTFKLNTLNPNSVVSGSGEFATHEAAFLKLECALGHNDCFRIEQSGEITYQGVLVFRFPSNDDASRFAKAFSHLIVLSGGKATKDPF